MRYLVGILSLALFALSCETTKQTAVTDISLKYHAIIACGSEWDMRSEEAAEWGERIVDLTAAEGISILSYDLEFVVVEHNGFCGNCSATGDILVVTAPESEEDALRALGFVD